MFYKYNMLGAVLKSIHLQSRFIVRNHTRSLYITKPAFDASKNYEGDGKTTVTILNTENPDLVLIDSYSVNGFRLNNGIYVIGPMAAFPRTVLQWNILSAEDINMQSLSLFYLLEPKLDILVVGTGEKIVPLNKEVRESFKKKNISMEIMTTQQACATYNFLNVERRCVAGAFVPPSTVPVFEEDLEILNTKTSGGFLT